jgi:arsenic resistance protein ArsH
MVSGGSQSFNTVNSLRVLGRWMRMFTIPNQSSVPIAYEKFTDEDAPEGGSRLMPGSNRDRLVDCVEEMVKYSIIMREHFDLFNDRFSERRAAENSALESLNSSGKDVVNGVNIKAI